jgi:hypothetical protein
MRLIDTGEREVVIVREGRVGVDWEEVGFVFVFSRESRGSR